MIKVYYEGYPITSVEKICTYKDDKFDVRDTPTKSDPLKIGVVNHHEDIVFTINVLVPEFRIGAYFVMTKVVDMSGQPYVDFHSIFRVVGEGVAGVVENVDGSLGWTENKLAKDKLVRSALLNETMTEWRWKQEILLEYTEYVGQLNQRKRRKKRFSGFNDRLPKVHSKWLIRKE